MEKLEYEANVKNHLDDPVLDVKNVRSEFRLNNNDANRVILSSLRLSLFGCSVAGNIHYNFSAGAYGLIRNIFLMDGNVVLDKLLEVGNYMAFKNYLGVNDIHANRNKFLHKDQIGYYVDGLGKQDGSIDDTDAPRTDVLLKQRSRTIPTTAEGQLGQSYIDLSSLLPMLKSVNVLPLSKFERLRIVIEYQTDINKVLGNNGNPFTTIRPILSYDELTDDGDKASAVRGFNSVSWNAIEHDRAFVPSVATAGVNVRADQEVNINVKNFRDKYVSRLVVMKNPQDTSLFVATNDISPMGAYASITSLNEEFNLKINGKPKLPRNLDRDNKRLALLNDSWGVANAYPLNATHGSDRNYHILASFDGAFAKKGQVGVQDYIGLDIEDKIMDMELLFKRTNEGTGGTDAEQYNTAIDLNLYAECRKAIVLSGDSYKVIYG